MTSQQPLSMETLVVSAGRPDAVPGAPLNPPIVPASTFHAGGTTEYARETAPSTEALEAAIGTLEGGGAVAFSSGMAAANAVMDLVPPGGIVVAPSAAYTGVAVRLRELDAAGRIRLRIVDADDTSAVVTACTGAALLWLESPTNPMMEVADLAACIAGAHAAGALALVDNTFATPILQNPLLLGADYVLHSATKFLAGHSDLLMGAIVCREPALTEQVRGRRVLLGAAPGAFDCYLALRGIRTLALRVERGQRNAQAIVDRLRRHPAVETVRYPGWGAMASIDIVGGAQAADAVCERVQVWTYATSLGGVESLIERRRRWPLESERVPDGLLRLAFGIEDVEDLWRDLDAALRG